MKMPAASVLMRNIFSLTFITDGDGSFRKRNKLASLSFLFFLTAISSVFIAHFCIEHTAAVEHLAPKQ